jgi:hypothetical protein
MKQFMVIFVLVAAASSLPQPNLFDFSQILNGQQKFENAKGCQVCETLVSFIDAFLNDTKVETALANELASLCARITNQKEQQICTKLVSKGVPALMHMLPNIMDSSLVCGNMFKLCPYTPPAPSKNPFANASIDDMECAACFTGFGFVKQAFLNSDFASYCITGIQQMCANIGDAERKQKCLDTVSKMVNKVFQGLTDIVNPKTLCTTKINAKCPSMPAQNLAKLFT